MSWLNWIILVGLILFGMIPIVLIVFLRSQAKNEKWGTIVERYQELISGTISLWAAAVALIGILMTIQAERDRTIEQLRDHRRQIASAFVGDISSLMAEVNSDLMWTNLNATLKALQDSSHSSGGSLIQLKFLVRISELYQANAAEIGQFEQPIPEWIAGVYNQYRNVIGHNDVMVEGANAKDTSSFSYLVDVAKEESSLIEHMFYLACATREMLEAVGDDPTSDRAKASNIAKAYMNQGISPKSFAHQSVQRPLTCPK